jgi:hypothetical protein
MKYLDDFCNGRIRELIYSKYATSKFLLLNKKCGKNVGLNAVKSKYA